MSNRIGFWAAVLTVLVTMAFAIAGVATPARSGPMCATWGCIPAPYTDVARFVPGDYLWMIPGLALIPIFVVLIASIGALAFERDRLLSRISFGFAIVYAVIVGVDYFTQFAVVAPSLQAGETQGLSLFTQYNPHGFFIAGEAIGYLAMSAALLFAAPLFTGPGLLRSLRWLLCVGFALAVAAVVGLLLLAGDLIAYEVALLSINWIVLIGCATLLAVLFRRAPGAPVASIG